MDVAIVFSRALTGITAPQVTVEVHLSRGLPSLSIVGLPETAVKESKDRVRSAILNNHLEFPLCRITINLAPADLPKEGGRFDLAIAIGILTASGQLPQTALSHFEFAGELALTGELRSVRGILPVAKAIQMSGRQLILPHDNAAEAVLIGDLTVLPARHLVDVCAHLNGQENLCVAEHPRSTARKSIQLRDLNEIKAQHLAKRALEIAATGSHNLLMIGPPGTGKTMLAERLPGILPLMSDTQALETAMIASISRQGFVSESWKQRPIRSPHHTASAVALVGGGSQPRPGEISLAHNGVLFLDELPEYDRKVLEVLREPLESGRIAISRAANQVEFPAEFQLIAAMNPCPCGYLGDSNGRCRCNSEMIRRYRAKISGPLLDRIDMHIEVPNIPAEILRNNITDKSESSQTVGQRVQTAYQHQLERAGKSNSKLNGKELEKFCPLEKEQIDLLEQAINKLGLSARAMHRILRVSRTIADLGGSKRIESEHLAEAISYRRLERTESTLY
jgi:magnesium chelatase family protein